MDSPKNMMGSPLYPINQDIFPFPPGGPPTSGKGRGASPGAETVDARSAGAAAAFPNPRTAPRSARCRPRKAGGQALETRQKPMGKVVI